MINFIKKLFGFGNEQPVVQEVPYKVETPAVAPVVEVAAPVVEVPAPVVQEQPKAEQKPTASKPAKPKAEKKPASPKAKAPSKSAKPKAEKKPAVITAKPKKTKPNQK